MSEKQQLHAFERAVFLGAAKVKKGKAAQVLPGLAAMLAGLAALPVVQENAGLDALARQAEGLLQHIEVAAQTGGAQAQVLEAYGTLVRFLPDMHGAVAGLVRGSSHPELPETESLLAVSQKCIELLGMA